MVTNAYIFSACIIKCVGCPMALSVELLRPLTKKGVVTDVCIHVCLYV